MDQFPTAHAGPRPAALESLFSAQFVSWGIAVVLLCFPVVSSAQIEDALFSLAGRAWSAENSCADAPAPCTGATSGLELGMNEFVLSRVLWSSSVGSVDIRLDWPESWSFLDWELCAGTLVSGDPSVRGSTLRFSFPDCPQEGAFLRVWMDRSGASLIGLK